MPSSQEVKSANEEATRTKSKMRPFDFDRLSASEKEVAKRLGYTNMFATMQGAEHAQRMVSDFPKDAQMYALTLYMMTVNMMSVATAKGSLGGEGEVEINPPSRLSGRCSSFR